jgi:outer membrane protein assembly factor BamB
MTRGRSASLVAVVSAAAGLVFAAPRIVVSPRAEEKMSVAAPITEGGLSSVWSRRTPAPIEHIWISAERVVIAAGGHLQGMERSGGRTVWEVKRRAQIASGTVCDSRLLFVDEADRMSAYQIDDGKALWSEPPGPKRKKTAGPASFVALPGGEEFLAVEASRVSRRGLADGRIAWSRDLPRADRFGALVLDEKLIFPAGRSVVAYRLDSGEPLWGEDLGGVSYLARLTESGDAVIAVTERDRVIRIDSASGRRAWQVEQSVALGKTLPPPGVGDAGALLYLEGASVDTDAAGGAVGITQLLVDGERAYVAGSDFSARAYDLTTGALRWSVPLRASASLHRAGALLCVQGTSPGLQCLEPASGRRVWEYPEDVENVITLAGDLLVLSAGRDLRLFDSRDGRPLGRIRLERRVISLHASPTADLLIAASRRALTALKVR